VYAKLGALLDPLARATGPDDPCTIGQRRHDALATLLDHAAAVTGHPDPAGSAPTHHGGSHVVGPARNDGTPTSAGPETGPIRTRPAGTRPSGSGPAGSGPAGSGPARGSGANEGGSASGGPRADAGSHGAAGDTGDTGGAAAITAAVGDAGRAHVLLITTPDALHGRPGHPPSDLDGYGPVSSETARQICCDADVTTVVVDDDGTPLDLGRTHRLPTRKQRLAVIARDRVCVGCGAPARRCQIHHIRWWRDLGRTDLDNLCLVCPGCHTNIHHFGWTVIRTDGRYRAGPPPPPT